ncbi:hypothetical protein J2T13_001924 [Paenibacillus sp. DS2015]
MTVVNRELNVSAVKVNSISGSSVFLVGDTQTINCSSVYDSTTEYIMNGSPHTSVESANSTLSNKGC